MTDGKVEMLRHTLATLAYRAGKALRGAPPEFATYGDRTPGQILAHLSDLLEWALSIVDGRQVWRNSEVGAWDADVARFFASLQAFDARVASGAPLQESP